MGWTNEQSEAINSNTGNLLVSAAAGSGKTAVLVERIIKKVTEGENPVDIDSIVVVTFTKAAADEMKSRLATSFEKKLDERPNDSHLIRQISLLDNAKITTIDSFCTYILKNYYNAIDLEPNFRVAEAGELSLIKEDIIKELTENLFLCKDKDFIDFIDAFVPGKKLDRLSELINGLYDFSQSNPWPEEWLRNCSSVYSISDVREYVKLPIVIETEKYIKGVIEDCISAYNRLIDFCDVGGGPVEYMDMLKKELEFLKSLLEIEDFEILMKLVGGYKFASFPRSSADADAREKVKGERNKVKNRLKTFVNRYGMDMEFQLEQLINCKSSVEILVNLTIAMMYQFDEYKRSKNILDFSDVEHLALNILLHKEDGKIVYSDIANELAMGYSEIYIDEYQDSNLVQEYILNAVSKIRFGEPNVFMVGDVKQSIYRFRMAKPELFMEKYDSYTTEESLYRKIELRKNFRSRPNVLNCINDVCYSVMKKDVGGIEYTEEVQLNAGMTPEDELDDATEIYFVDKNEFNDEDISNQELCAHVAADRIHALMEKDDKLDYKDIVILLRSDKSSGPVYASILNSHGIPAIYGSTTGYFSSPEIKSVLDLLSIIDNPRQEIPLAGVMRSYFAYFTARELASVKGPKRRTQLYDCIIERSATTDSLGVKCKEFLDMLNQYRDLSKIYTISELLTKIIYETGYYDYCSALIGGKIKKANLEMLIVKACDYEATSYTSVFNFIRYIEKLQKYNVEYGEAQSETEENTVKIMSIHHSKGLEFPVVIIGDIAKKFNMKDTAEPIIYDDISGVGINHVDLDTRVKEKCVYKSMIARRMKSDSIGEEIRILYVAMTRAVNKLIMIGADKRNKSAKWDSISGDEVDSTYINEAQSYADLVIAATKKSVKTGEFIVKFPNRAEIEEIASKVIGINSDINSNKNVASLLSAHNISPEIYDRIKNQLEYTYPHSDVFSLRAKYSVSELKHKAMEESELLEAAVVEPQRDKPVPSFIEDRTQESGISRGNAYHKFFEIFDYQRGMDYTSIKEMLSDFTEHGRISEEYAKLIYIDNFVKFINSELGQSMKRASEASTLFREQPFIMEIEASEVDASYPSDEKVLIQGIIDAFYFENDKVYIVDYKTDNVPDGIEGETILIERYRKQLILYVEALSKITGKEIGGCYIYSVRLNKKIEITGD